MKLKKPNRSISNGSKASNRSGEKFAATGKSFSSGIDEDKLELKVQKFINKIKETNNEQYNEFLLLNRTGNSLKMDKNRSSERESEKNGEFTDMIQEEYDLALFEQNKIRKVTFFLDFYSATFYALMKKYKKKHKLLTEDQVSYYFESLVLVAIQVIFCLSIFGSGEVEPKYTYDYFPNLAMFFTNMVMHYGCIAIIRNGISMCKYVVFHFEEFSNPVETFMLGIFIMIGNMFCEITNGYSALSYTSVTQIISKFVGFKILI